MAANDSLRNSGSKDSTVVLTAVGPDRIGLVEEISAFIVRLQCNIEDSKMAVFCGEFAVILLVSGSTDNLLQLTTHHE
jgi:glycine cleavage system transcriptional repressor